MGIIVYQCDTCKRDIEMVRNEHGLDTTARCVITHRCHGSLHKIAERPTGVFGKDVKDVPGLENYRPRNVMYQHEQTISASSWKINHKLNAFPSIRVYIDYVDPQGHRTHLQMDPDDYVVTNVDQNNVEIDFATTTTGIVHLISRNSTPYESESVEESISYHQISANGILTIAAKVSDQEVNKLTKRINFISPTTSVIQGTNVEFTAHKFEGSIALFNTPWQEKDLINLGGALLKVYSARISDVMHSLNVEEGSPFYISETEDYVILSSMEPFIEGADIDDHNILYPHNIATTSVTANSRTVGNELTIDQTQIVEYHPPIRIIKTIFQ